MTIPNDSAPATRWTGMDAGILKRTRRASIISSIVLGIPFATYFGVNSASAWLAGVAWSLVNLHFIAVIVKAMLSEQRNLPRIIMTMVVKFPLLYFAGFLLLRSGYLPALWIVAGFTWPFGVIVLKGAGRAYMKLDEMEAK